MKSDYLNCRTIQPPKQEGDIEWHSVRFERILASLELMEKLGIIRKKMPWREGND